MPFDVAMNLSGTTCIHACRHKHRFRTIDVNGLSWYHLRAMSLCKDNTPAFAFEWWSDPSRIHFEVMYLNHIALNNPLNICHIFSLQLLSVLLVIYHVASTNINEPLIDARDPLAMLTSPMDLLTNSRILADDGRHKTNQSSDISGNTINHAISVDNSAQVQMPRTQPYDDAPVNSANSVNMSSPINSTKASTRKVYNKNDLRKRKIKSADIEQLAEWKCPNFSENSRYLECGCDLSYTLRCSGDIHGLQQIAEGLRTSAYPVSLLDCTLKNVTFLSDARIFDNVSLRGLVISSGEIKRVHRQAFLGLKSPLKALGLPNNALPSVPAQSLSPLTSLDHLDLSNNRIKYLDASDFLVSAFECIFLNIIYTRICTFSRWNICKLEQPASKQIPSSNLCCAHIGFPIFIDRYSKIWPTWNWAITISPEYQRDHFSRWRNYKRWNWTAIGWRRATTCRQSVNALIWGR